MRRCCSASVSVGTRRAACAPASTAWQMASAATAVLPEPTSPCSRRRMGRGRARSRPISRAARRCSPVSSNGSASSSGPERSPVGRRGGAARRRSSRRRTASSPSWSTISSSRTRRRRPRRASSRERGKCTATRASAAPPTRSRARIQAGSGSGGRARQGPRQVDEGSRMRRAGMRSVAGYTGTSPGCGPPRTLLPRAPRGCGRSSRGGRPPRRAPAAAARRRGAGCGRGAAG